MRRFSFSRSWHLMAGAAGLAIVGAVVAPQMLGVETRPVNWPAAEAAKASSDDARVAERIGLDPSIRETPALPAENKVPARARITDADSADAEASAAELQPETRLKPIPEPPAAETPTSLAWPVPAALLLQLDRLAESDPATAEWVAQAK